MESSRSLRHALGAPCQGRRVVLEPRARADRDNMKGERRWLCHNSIADEVPPRCAHSLQDNSYVPRSLMMSRSGVRLLINGAETSASWTCIAPLWRSGGTLFRFGAGMPEELGDDPPVGGQARNHSRDACPSLPAQAQVRPHEAVVGPPPIRPIV